MLRQLTSTMNTEYRDDEEHPSNSIPRLTDEENDTESQDGYLHISNASDSSENGLPIPMWMRESAKSFKYRWVPLPLRKAGRATIGWIKGPTPPRELRIIPFYPQVQEAPLRLMNRYLPKQRHRICLLIGFYAIWFLTWSLMLRHNTSSGYIEGYGKPSNIWCGASFWSVTLSILASGMILMNRQEQRQWLWFEWQWLQTLLVCSSSISLSGQLQRNPAPRAPSGGQSIYRL